MARYDFDALTPYDFELVVRDLFQERLGRQLETFTPGRDSGIDVRYLGRRGSKIVIQCKKWRGEAWAKLQAAMKIEKPKMDKLKPSRYILATTVEMTPDRKKELHAILKPWMKSPNDVYGRDDVNNLLRDYPQVEGRHFKLWLASTEVLQRVLHSDIYQRSERFREAIQFDMRVYVQTDAFPRAKRMLNDKRVCIITGSPGVGKTTLANMLALDYVTDERWEVVRLGQSANEANRVWADDRNQLFYFDDFLGRVALSSMSLATNEDIVLLDLIDSVIRSERKRFILTTRGYILAAAGLKFERLESSQVRLHEYVLRASDYSQFDKARILYNHLSMSPLNEDAKLALLENRRYWKVIRHPNYSPRLVYYMTTSPQAQAVQSRDFAAFVFRVLDDPAELWRHIVENELDHRARAIVLVLALLPDEVEMDELASAVESYLELLRLQTDLTFRQALKVLEGTFITIGIKEPYRVISFRDPSVLDFVIGWLSAQPSEVSALVRAAIHFEQPLTLWELNQSGVQRFGRQLRTVLKLPANPLVEALARTIDAQPCTVSETLLPTTPNVLTLEHAREKAFHSDRLRQLIQVFLSTAGAESETPVLDLLQNVEKKFDKVLSTDGGWRLFRLVALMGDTQGEMRHRLGAIGGRLKATTLAGLKDVDDFDLLLSLRKHLPAEVSDSDMDLMSRAFRDKLAAWIAEAESFEEPESVDELLETIDSCGSALDVDVTYAIELLEEIRDNIPGEDSGRYDDYDDDERASDHYHVEAGDIDSLFDSLR